MAIHEDSHIDDTDMVIETRRARDTSNDWWPLLLIPLFLLVLLGGYAAYQNSWQWTQNPQGEVGIGEGPFVVSQTPIPTLTPMPTVPLNPTGLGLPEATEPFAPEGATSGF